MFIAYTLQCTIFQWSRAGRMQLSPWAVHLNPATQMNWPSTNELLLLMLVWMAHCKRSALMPLHPHVVATGMPRSGHDQGLIPPWRGDGPYQSILLIQLEPPWSFHAAHRANASCLGIALWGMLIGCCFSCVPWTLHVVCQENMDIIIKKIDLINILISQKLSLKRPTLKPSCSAAHHPHHHKAGRVRTLGNRSYPSCWRHLLIMKPSCST